MYNYQMEKPEGKSNCIVVLFDSNERIPAIWHVKKACFVGKYNKYQDVELDTVEWWEYAIVKDKISYSVEESLILLNMPYGEQELSAEFSKMDADKQEKLYNDFLELETKIKLWLKENAK